VDREGDERMLETSKERVALLKAGIDGKTIEKLYIIYNNFKIVSNPGFFDAVKINTHVNINTFNYEKVAGLSL